MVGSSLWLWTIEAPAAKQARASATISSGVRGTCGLNDFGSVRATGVPMAGGDIAFDTDDSLTREAPAPAIAIVDAR